MLFKGVNITMASGKIDTAVASVNRGTPYFRSLGPTVNPNTTEQQEVRNAVQYANAEWAGQTEDFRTGWARWAQTRRRTDRICNRRPRTGWNEFLRWSVPRGQAVNRYAIGLLQSVTAPLDGEEEQDPTLYLEFRTDAQVFVYFDDTDDWVTEAQSVLLLWVSAPIPATRNRAYGGYNMVAAIGITGNVPAFSGTIVDLPTSWASGERLFWRARISTELRGMSSPQYGRIVYP
jgi:hypothetical protein